MSNISAQELCTRCGVAWYEEADATALADKLATDIAHKLQRQLDSSTQASLVVSGGSTPAPVFRQLAQTGIDWARVSVTLADERWVAPGHKDSNESLVRDTLLVDKASAASFVSLYRAGVSPEDAIASISSDIALMQQPFTVSILGMGEDGHTASLFPDAPADELHRAMALENDALAVVMHPPSVPQVRLSLTRSVLLASNHRILHITGASKRQVLADSMKAAMSDGKTFDAYAPPLKPIIGLLTSHPQSASVYWSS